MKIKKDNIKSNIDRTLNFNKSLHMQSLNKKFGKYFQKSMILKASKKESL